MLEEDGNVLERSALFVLAREFGRAIGAQSSQGFSRNFCGMQCFLASPSVVLCLFGSKGKDNHCCSGNRQQTFRGEGMYVAEVGLWTSTR